jgi:hypothetical protein
LRIVELMQSRRGKAIVIACLPYLLALVFFYSLAIHMHMALGGWPERIGTEGFPPALLMHAGIQGAYMSGLLFFTVFVAPALLLICLLVPMLRRLAVYFALQGVGLLVFLGQMYLAPEGYVYWWWD